MKLRDYKQEDGSIIVLCRKTEERSWAKMRGTFSSGLQISGKIAGSIWKSRSRQLA